VHPGTGLPDRRHHRRPRRDRICVWHGQGTPRRARHGAHRGGEEAAGTKIIITEIPYQVNKSTLIERIAELVREDKIDQISDLRDESTSAA
jgi:hypothetical protein